MKIRIATTLCILLLHTCADAGVPQRVKSKPKRTSQTLEDGLTPLMRAAARGRIDTVRYLLKTGVDVNEKDGIGITALMIAAKTGNLEIIKTLLDAGADPNAVGGFAHGGIFSALTLGMNRSNEKWTEVLDMLIAAGAKMNPPSEHPAPPLNYAIEQRDTEMIKVLLARGAEVNRKNDIGHTPLVTAIAVAEPDVEIVKVLLAAGADPNVPRLWVGDDHMTLLSYVEGWLKESSDKDREEIVRLLKRAGAKW